MSPNTTYFQVSLRRRLNVPAEGARSLLHAAVIRDQTAQSVAEEGGGREVNCVKGPQARRLEKSGGF
jgi:hypothetical protein